MTLATASVFLVAAPIALAGFAIAALLREQPLRGHGPAGAQASEPRDAPSQQERIAA